MGNLFDKAKPLETEGKRAVYQSAFSIAMQEGMIEGVHIPVREKPVYIEDHQDTVW